MLPSRLNDRRLAVASEQIHDLSIPARAGFVGYCAAVDREENELTGDVEVALIEVGGPEVGLHRFDATENGSSLRSAASILQAGAGSNDLRLSIGIDDYAGSIATTGAIGVGGSLTGNIETTGDTDWFRLTLTAGETYRFDLQGSATSQGTLFDPVLQILDSSGNLITVNDNGGPGYDALISGFTPATSGTYYLSAGSSIFGATGTYRISATRTITGTETEDVLNGTGSDDVINGLGGDDVINSGAGNDQIEGGAGWDIVTVSGSASAYRLLADGDNFILKGPDGGDRLTNVEAIKFADGTTLDLARMYGPDIDARAWADGRIPEALLSGGNSGGERPLVLPGPAGEDDLIAKDTGAPEVLPGADEGAGWVWNYDDAPLVLPEAEDVFVVSTKAFDGPEVLPSVDDSTSFGAKGFDLFEVLPGLDERTLFTWDPASLHDPRSGQMLTVDEQGLVVDHCSLGNRGSDSWGF